MIPTRREFRENHLRGSPTSLRGLNEFITATSVCVLVDTHGTGSHHTIMPLGNYEFRENRSNESLPLLEGFK
jgi:hypothetical protein